MEINIEDYKKVIFSIRDMLNEKNKRYGNAALEPINVFYKGSATDSICIRLDDKLSRIKNSTTLRKNDLFDLLGYCLLYLINIKQPYGDFSEKLDAVLGNFFVDKPTLIMEDFEMYNATKPDTFLYDGFYKNYKDKTNEIIQALNGVCSEIKSEKTVDSNRVFYLIEFLIVYFVQNGITDFSDLID